MIAKVKPSKIPEISNLRGVSIHINSYSFRYLYLYI